MYTDIFPFASQQLVKRLASQWKATLLAGEQPAQGLRFLQMIEKRRGVTRKELEAQN